jgi:hypothetical protein
MANYPFVSAKGILPRVIRAVGYKLPSTYHDDILEWIPEGMGLLHCTPSVQITETADESCPGEFLVKAHCVRLPKDFIQLEGVYNSDGLRLTPGNRITSDLVLPQEIMARSSNFNVNPFSHQTSTGLPSGEPGNGGVPWSGSDIEMSKPVTDGDQYLIKGNTLQVSFEEGYVKIRYYAIPLCEDGYPMIPDNENFKQALEWHIIRRLIGSGYLHPVFTYLQADELYERSAARALSDITYPTPDKAARTNRTLIRLIPPDRFLQDYFING